jgi:hypothetical protein
VTNAILRANNEEEEEEEMSYKAHTHKYFSTASLKSDQIF